MATVDMRAISTENSEWEPRDRSGQLPLPFDDRKNTGVHKMSAGRFDWMWQERFCLTPLKDKLGPSSSFSFQGWGIHFVWPKGFGLT